VLKDFFCRVWWEIFFFFGKKSMLCHVTAIQRKFTWVIRLITHLYVFLYWVAHDGYKSVDFAVYGGAGRFYGVWF
jgi:hypothetical protein